MNANMNLYPTENVKRDREGMPWSEEEISLLIQCTEAGSHPDAAAFALKRNKNEVILKGLELGILAVERVIPVRPIQVPPPYENQHDEWNEFSTEPRSLNKLIHMANVFSDKIWLVRHLASKYRIEQGLEAVDPEIWAQALTEEARIIQQHGREALGPYNDFEWGMLNGKLSALRWVLGCEWDMLDT